MNSGAEQEARRVRALLPAGSKLAVLGSTSFWSEDGRHLCEALAVHLAAATSWVALTGGMEGVGRTFGRAFAGSRRGLGRAEDLFHLLPRGCGSCDSGVTLEVGSDHHARREVLGRVGDVYLVIEGGPGTSHEVDVALRRGAPVLPVGRTGGHAGELHARLRCPHAGARLDWEALGDREAHGDEVVGATARLLRSVRCTLM